MFVALHITWALKWRFKMFKTHNFFPQSVWIKVINPFVYLPPASTKRWWKNRCRGSKKDHTHVWQFNCPTLPSLKKCHEFMINHACAALISPSSSTKISLQPLTSDSFCGFVPSQTCHHGVFYACFYSSSKAKNGNIQVHKNISSPIFWQITAVEKF